MSNSSTTNRKPKTLTDHMKALGAALLIVALMLLLLEILLAVFDPWGMRYFNDLAQMGNEDFVADPARGYTLPDGRYDYSYWQATVADGGRLIPANQTDAACEIAILGDSVGFGYGVADEAVWVNAVAAALTDVQFTNLSVPRYNSSNVLRAYHAYPGADAYVYLVIDNDVRPATDPTTETFVGDGSGLPWLIRYTNFAIFQGGRSGTPRLQLADNAHTQRFFNEVAQLTEDERVYLAAFADEPATNSLLEAGFDLTVLTWPPYRISFADYHLNVQGNAALAQQMLPLFETIRAERCAV